MTPRPLNQRSSSASRSKVPAVSTEKAWTFLGGKEVARAWKSGGKAGVVGEDDELHSIAGPDLSQDLADVSLDR